LRGAVTFGAAAVRPAGWLEATLPLRPCALARPATEGGNCNPYDAAVTARITGTRWSMELVFRSFIVGLLELLGDHEYCPETWQPDDELLGLT
jgi:hypothetical protein